MLWLILALLGGFVAGIPGLIAGLLIGIYLDDEKFRKKS